MTVENRLETIMANGESSSKITTFFSSLPPVEKFFESVRQYSIWDFQDCDTSVQEQPAVPWERLPPEILTEIFSYLDLHDKESVENSCQSWRRSCDTPSLWSRMTFYFNGVDSFEVVTEAYRLIENKGQYLRSLVIKIGLPTLTKAWLMSQGVQHLLEFISRHPSSQNIEHLCLKNLNFSKDWRFFTVSKDHIIRALGDFLSHQKNLKSIDMTSCKLGAPNGMRLLRSLKCGHCRYTVQRLELRDFFCKNYTAVKGHRFSIVLYTSLLALQELGLDARHLDDKTLRRLTEQSVCRRRLKHLKLFFQPDKSFRSFVSRQSWQDAVQACPSLRVSVYVCGWMGKQSSKALWADTMPVSQCVITWSPPYRHKREAHCGDLIFLIQDLGERFSTKLETFKLTSRDKSTRDIDSALLQMISKCHYLTTISVIMDNVFQDVRENVAHITSQRPFNVRLSFSRRNVRHGH